MLNYWHAFSCSFFCEFSHQLLYSDFLQFHFLFREGKVHPLMFIHHTSTYQASMCKLIEYWLGTDAYLSLMYMLILCCLLMNFIAV